MRLGWRPVTGVKTVQSECGILATATPAPLRKNSGKYILAQHRALLQFETQALQHRLYESHGVREASWISLSGCHPNRGCRPMQKRRRRNARRSGCASDVRSGRTGGQNLELFLGAQENG